jgi:pyruvate dehydrogenase E1 component
MTDQSLTRFLAPGEETDLDPGETAEWRDVFLALVDTEGPARARFILDQLAVLARDPHVARGEAWFDHAVECAGDGRAG